MLRQDSILVFNTANRRNESQTSEEGPLHSIHKSSAILLRVLVARYNTRYLSCPFHKCAVNVLSASMALFFAPGVDGAFSKILAAILSITSSLLTSCGVSFGSITWSSSHGVAIKHCNTVHVCQYTPAFFIFPHSRIRSVRPTLSVMALARISVEPRLATAP